MTMELNKVIHLLYIDRREDSIKNDFGKGLIIGGSLNYPNSVILASEFATISGNGYTALAVCKSIYPSIISRCHPSCIYEISESDESISFSKAKQLEIIKKYNAILFGNGVIESKENRELLIYLLNNYEGNLIIDATGLTILSKLYIDHFKPKVLLTPHLGEAKKLFKVSLPSRNIDDYLIYAKEYCLKHHCSILLKSYQSVLIDENGKITKCDYLPTPSLAKAGSGDGLAGFLLGLLSYADKIIDYNDVIIFADTLIHKAAKKAEENFSSGISNILFAKDEIIKIIQEELTH